jgi:hypothetical protein
MCVFCAAIPATLAVGVNLNTKQIRERRESRESEGAFLEAKRIPTGKLTLIAAGMLVVASVVYHSHNNV